MNQFIGLYLEELEEVSSHFIAITIECFVSMIMLFSSRLVKCVTKYWFGLHISQNPNKMHSFMFLSNLMDLKF